MKQITVSDIAKMPIQERISLVEDIWDSIAELPETVEIPDWQKAELDKRLEAYHKNPNAGSPWSEVKKRIIEKHGKNSDCSSRS
ncbi:MAG: addiction module protein [Nitrospinae bacterium]|nr:addiction module protein [Nitrospinota bacterium]